MMTSLDTSVALAHLLGENRHPDDVLWQQRLVSSRLLEYELWVRINARGLARTHGDATRDVLRVVALVEMAPLVLARAIEPFPTDTLIPYDPGYLAGWTVERYQIDLVNAAAQSRRQMESSTRSMCSRQVPGDTQRNLVVNSTFTDQKFKHVLVPVWVLTYTFRNKTYQVVVNGVTGKIDGRRPWSWIKISLAVLVALIIWYIAATN